MKERDIAFDNRLARLEETLNLLDQKIKRIYPENNIKENFYLQEIATLIHDISCKEISCDWYLSDWNSNIKRKYIRRAKFLQKNLNVDLIAVLNIIKDSFYIE
jgi:hypothetical protein